ncbi:MAG: pyridoxal-phosphate dependent enzyme, partial [Candidatus Izemoplasmatales bacterium]
RNPFKAMRAVFESGGTWLSVSDTQILDAMKLLGKTEGIFSEPAAAASIAGMIQAMEKGFIQKEDHVVCISTGNGLKDTKTALEALKRPVDLKNDFHQLLDYITENKGELLS